MTGTGPAGRSNWELSGPRSVKLVPLDACFDFRSSLEQLSVRGSFDITKAIVSPTVAISPEACLAHGNLPAITRIKHSCTTHQVRAPATTRAYPRQWNKCSILIVQQFKVPPGQRPLQCTRRLQWVRSGGLCVIIACMSCALWDHHKSVHLRCMTGHDNLILELASSRSATNNTTFKLLYMDPHGYLE